MKQKILLVFLGTEKPEILENNLIENNYQVFCCSAEDAAIQETVMLLKPDIMVLYQKQANEKILDKVHLIQSNTPLPIIIFAESCREALVSEAITAGASSFVVDNMESHRIQPIIEAGTARFKKCQLMKTKLNETEQKLIERRDIDRAKGILMKHRNINEDEAYKLLRKIAMDKNQRIGQVANTLVQATELLD